MRVTSRGRLLRGAKGWAEVIKRYQESGLTQEEFCNREKISSGSLFKWRRKLSETEEGAKFVEVSGGLVERGGHCSEVEIRFSDGVVLQVRS